MSKLPLKIGIAVCGVALFALGGAAGVYFGRNGQNVAADSVFSTTVEASTETTENATELTTLLSETATEVKAADITVTKAGSWGSDEDQFVQYNVDIKSTGDTITDWSVIMKFDREVTVNQIWGGNYEVSGKTLKITAVDYNKEISTNGINFGFTAEFEGMPDEPTVKLYSNGKELNTTDPIQSAGKAGSELVDTAQASPAVKTTAASGETPVAANGQLSVKGTKIVNQSGQPFVIKGVSTHGIAWFPQYITKDGFQTLRDSMGVNTVRLALYSSAGEGYTTELHKKVDEGVKYATELGMYVVIDWHILNDGNPNTDKTAAEAFFKEMAGKYKDNNNVLYEICNEPNGDVQWERDIKPYAESMIATIRAIDNDAIVIVGTPTWSQDVDAAAKSPLSDKNTVYALHFYAATHKQDLRNKAQTAINAGLPLLVSEFGICDASGNGGIDEAEADKWMEFLDSNSVGRICWNLSNKNEASALISSSCQKTSGWSDSDLSQEGKWLKKTYTK
jgi:endoglucanase